ncbi:MULTISPECIES: hypothetical protein [unclassified Microcoleus]
MYSEATPQQFGNPVNMEIGLTEVRLIDRSQISSSKARLEAMYFIK